MKNKVRFFVFTGILACTFLFAVSFRSDDPVLDKLVNTLQHWTDSIPQEKVYLHMDKPYYALGDTIYFKGYLAIGPRHQLSSLSGAMYVELFDDRDSLLQQLKLPVTSGMVMGDFILNDNLQEGNYRIRAYTQWMRNAGQEYFYDHTFLVVNGFSSVISKAIFGYKKNDNKSEFSALLNYTNEQGSALSEKDIHFEIRLGKKTLMQQNGKTDALGSIKVPISDEITKNSQGAYIHTILQNSGHAPVVRDFPVKSGFSENDIQFFAEGGDLVNGITSRLAFKAIGVDGLAINIKGTVTDNDNKEVAKISTLHAGMGSFSLSPQPGKSYTANIIFDDGSTKSVSLPQASNKGYVLSVYQPGADSILVRIHALDNELQSSLKLIVHVNGEIIFSIPLKAEKPISSIWLPKKNFPSGIAQFTLFNSVGEPLNERIAFVRSNDQMSLDIKTAKAVYKSKERVQITVNARNGESQPTTGNFSVAVIDENKVPIDENKESTIFSNLLLTSDLKGYIEQPNYYFAQKGDEVDKALDNLMLTQGYRRFTWKTLNDAKPRFAVEGLGTSISGKVTTLGHKPIANASVILTALKAKVTKLTTTDSLGRFKYDKLFITDSIKFTIQARNGQSDHVIVEMDTVSGVKIGENLNWPDLSTDIHTVLKPYIEKLRQQDKLYERLGMLDKVHRLHQVDIRTKKIVHIPANEIAPQGMFQVHDQSADQVINVDIKEASNYLSLAQYLQARLQGIGISQGPSGSSLQMLGQNSSYGSSQQGVALFLNGRRITNVDEISEILDSSYQPEDIAKIEVVRTNRAMISYLGGPGVMILTKLGATRKTYNPSIANISPKGYNKVREFYSPRYDRLSKVSSQPDPRTTIYWNPYLKTDVNGNATFDFFNADGPGNYRVVVEGINADGQLGRQIYRYTVDESQLKNNASAPADQALAKITTPVDNLNKQLPVEKVYMHIDKPYYNIGDTLWFKSYTLNGVNFTPTRISGLLYVELVDDSAHVARRISVSIKDGQTIGQIALKNGIFKEGGYTLRAYTNWMQNFKGAYVFSQRFFISRPSLKTWIVNSTAKLQTVGDKDEIYIKLRLSYAGDISHAVAYQKVNVKLYDDERHYLTNQAMQTGADGSLDIEHELSTKADGRKMRIEISSLDKDEHYKVVQVPVIINRNQNIDVQFLPEGGHLVAGIKSVMGFKAVAEDGLGTAVSGSIYDSKGNEVVSFVSLYKGMGSFEFTPLPGEAYTARINQPVVKTLQLPVIHPAGMVMHIDNPEQGDSLKIQINGGNSSKLDSAYYLIGMSRGSIYYSAKVNFNNPDFKVAKSQFPSGVTKFTLFAGQIPLAERLIYIENNDALKINIKPNKLSYKKRDSIGLEIEVRDKAGMPVQGSFSLAVTDDSQVRPDSLDNNGIVASLLLKSELKGTIETPGFYLAHKDKRAWRALDNLMLTQGWAGYEWKDIFAHAQPIKFKPEQPYIVQGRASNVLNKPLINNTIRLTSLLPPFSEETTTDSLGLFKFNDLPHLDSGVYLLQAINNKGSVKSFGEVSVERFKSVIAPEIPAVPIIPWYVNVDTTTLNYIKRKSVIEKDDYFMTEHVLNQVDIKSTKVIPESRNTFGPGGSDMVFDQKDIKASGATNLYEILSQKLPGFKVVGARWIIFRGNKEILPVLEFNGYSIDLRMNGWPLPIDVDLPMQNKIQTVEANSIKDVIAVPLKNGRNSFDINENTPDVIEALSDMQIEGLKGIEVAYSRKNTNRAGYVDFDWAHVELTTISGPPTAGGGAATTKYRPMPITTPKSFYSPKYQPNIPLNQPDYRPTVYWEPNIITDRNGKAHLSFYTTDIVDGYTLKIAGVSENGDIGNNTFKFK